MDKVIWNDTMTMNFLASKYLAGYIVGSNTGEYRVRVQIEGTVPPVSSTWSGLHYAICKSKEEAKECLARLTKKLVLAGVIAATEKENTDRFDRVELQEGDDEDD